MVLIVGGLLIVILAEVAAFTSPLRLPAWVYSLLLLALPLAMAMAVRKQAQVEKPHETTG